MTIYSVCCLLIGAGLGTLLMPKNECSGLVSFFFLIYAHLLRTQGGSTEASVQSLIRPETLLTKLNFPTVVISSLHRDAVHLRCRKHLPGNVCPIYFSFVYERWLADGNPLRTLLSAVLPRNARVIGIVTEFRELSFAVRDTSFRFLRRELGSSGLALGRVFRR